MKVYISGGITGVPGYLETFAAAEARLRANGHTPVNPTTIGINPTWTWADYMHAAINLQRECQGIYMLPGWTRSRGATIEWWIAHALRQRIWGASS